MLPDCPRRWFRIRRCRLFHGSRQGRARLFRAPKRGRLCGRNDGETELLQAAENRPLAVVTGASSGIGRELAAWFADNGYDLVVAAEDERIEPATRSFAGHGIQAVPVCADLATFDGVEDAASNGVPAVLRRGPAV